MKRTFFGGFHPQDKKAMSVQQEVTIINPSKVVIPMQQHLGVPCSPLVQVGDYVLRGQKIGEGEGLCVPVHASVSGKVTAIENRPHPSLGQCLAVEIENDYKDATVEAHAEPTTADGILAAIREAGIIGMGGAAFPGNIKALTAMGKVDTLIANGCECEPYITADDTLLRTRPERVLKGMKILADMLKPNHVVIAIEDNKKVAIAIMKELIQKYDGFELKVLPTKYPQGAEKQLVQTITGKEIAPGQLPLSVGCVVFNVATYAAIYTAVKRGVPAVKRIVTVTGEGIVNPQNFMVPIGTSFQDLIDAAGGFRGNVDRVLAGGPMMGFAQDDLSVPVVKATGCVLVLTENDGVTAPSTACLRCGKCSAVCPMRLQPLYINRYVKAGNLEEVKRLNVMDCLECGSCAYNCPAKISLVEGCKLGKKMIKEEKK